MDQNKQNIIAFDSYKTLYNDHAEQRSFKEYLLLLSFSELIAESNAVMRELRNGKLNSELTNRSRLILKEFERRIGCNPTQTKQHLPSDNVLNFAQTLQ